MNLDLLEILKIGGPVLALSLAHLYYSNRRAAKMEDLVKDLTLMATNHLAHIEPGLEAINESIHVVGTTIERLVTRIDSYNDRYRGS